nr:elongation of very long chain fatty acids protein 6-like D protein [Hemicentrotus pulcherrimus]
MLNSTWFEFLTVPWELETLFDPLPWQLWMRREGMILWIACTAFYLTFIFEGAKLMKTRPKFELRLLLVIWNSVLTVFSMLSAWRLTIAAYELVSKAEMWNSLVCGPNYYAPGGISSFWLLLFAFSKVAEYGDTVFIVLRKSKLILLHWFHHILTFLVGFHTFAYSNPTLFISALMNVYIHSLMYFYYVVRILGVRVPKRLSMILTTIQIIQLIIGTYVQFYVAWIYFFGGRPCELDLFGVVVGSFGYGSVCLLFIDFFVKSYIMKGNRQERSSLKVETHKDR